MLQQPEKFYAELPVRTLTDIQNSSSPGLAEIRRDNGDIVAKAVVIIALDDLIEFYNVKNTFTDAQINQTATLILETFFWFKLDDFKLCFNRAKTGYYGAAYNRLDGSVIFEWLNRYAEERAQHFAMNNELAKLKEPAVRAQDTRAMHKLYDQVVLEQMEQNARRKLNRVLEERAREKAIEAWHREYDEYFEGNEITPEMHQAYVMRNPLSESYIRYFITKELSGDGNVTD